MKRSGVKRALLFSALFILAPFCFSASAADLSSNWTQINWSGGNYSSKDAYIDANSTPGQLTLTLNTSQFQDDNYTALNQTFANTSIWTDGRIVKVKLAQTKGLNSVWQNITTASVTGGGPRMVAVDVADDLTSGYIFMVKGGNTNVFLEYNFSNTTWSSSDSGYPAAIPFTYGLTAGTVFSYGDLRKFGDKVFLVRGQYGGGSCSTNIAWYNVTTRSWTSMTSLPNACYGPHLAMDSNKLYVFSGGDRYNGEHDQFLSYDLSNGASGAWCLTMLALSEGNNTSYGGSMALVDTDNDGIMNYLFALQGNSARRFYKYDIATPAWHYSVDNATDSEAPTSVPSNVHGHTSLIAVDSDTLYAITDRELSTITSFRKYSIASRTWSNVVDVPVGLSQSSISYCGGNKIYFHDGANSGLIRSYNISNNTGWSSLADLPFQVNNNYETMVSLDTNNDGIEDDIYYVDGANSSTYRYDIAGATWYSSASYPGEPKAPKVCPAYGNGNMLAAFDNRTLYFLKAGVTKTFYNYDTVSRAWTALIDTPYDVDYNGSMVAVDSNGDGAKDCLYASIGSGATNFCKYNTSGSWHCSGSDGESPPVLPAIPGPGHMLVAVDSNNDGKDEIYAVRGYSSSDFWMFNLTTNQWSSSLAQPPYTIEAGRYLVAMDNATLLLATGGTDNILLKYNITGDSWVTLLPAPDGLPFGDGISVKAGPDAYYLMKGLNSTTFYKYTPTFAPVGTFTSRIHDTNLYPALGNMSWNTVLPVSQTNITYRVRGSDSAAMSGASAWSGLNNITNDSDISSQVSDGLRYLQYQANLSTTDTSSTPYLNNVTINYTGYPRTVQELISNKTDSGSDSNVITKLERTAAISGLDNVSMQLRTASSSVGLDSATWYGPTGTSDYYAGVSGAVSFSNINATHRDGSNDRWMQYKVRLSTAGVSTPTLTSVKIYYGSPLINVTNPIAGATYTYGGTPLNIQWDSNGLGSVHNVAIAYSVNGGGSYTGIADVPATDGSYSWPIPNVNPTIIAKIKISNADFNINNTTDNFTILPAVYAANGVVGTSQLINWSCSGTSNVRLDWSRDAGASWMDKDGNIGCYTVVTNSGCYTWTPPLPSNSTDSYLFGVTNDTDGSPRSQSPEFNITKGTLSPADVQPELLQIGRTGNVSVNFTTKGVIPVNGKVRVTLPSGFSFNSTGTTTASSGTATVSPTVSIASQTVTVTVTSHELSGSEVINLSNIKTPMSANPGAYYISIRDASDTTVIEDNTSVTGDSFSGFNITSPTTGTVWAAGSQDNAITWDTVGSVSSNIMIQYSSNGGSWSHVMNGSLEATYPNAANPQLWDILGSAPISSNYQLRITDVGSTPADPSDDIVSYSNNFSVSGGITLAAPLGGEKWSINTTHNIVWSKQGTFNTKIEYSSNGGGAYSALTGGGSSDSGLTCTTFSWTPSAEFGSNTGSNTVRIKVSDASTSNPPSSSNSTSNFAICSLKLGALSGSSMSSSRANVTETVTIPWSQVGVDYVRLQYYSNLQGAYANISGATALSSALGTYNWVVPDDVGSGIKVRAIAVNSTGAQDPAIEGLVENYSSSFAIAGSLNIDLPNGGSFKASDPLDIHFTGSSSINAINFYYKPELTSASNEWVNITSALTYSYVSGIGSATWLPDTSDNSVWLIIEDANNPGVNYTTVSSISLTGVGLNDTVVTNSPYTVDGSTFINGTAVIVDAGTVNLTYSTTGEAGSYSTLGSGANSVEVSSGGFSYNWAVPNQIGSNIYIKVTDPASGATAARGPVIIRAGFNNANITAPADGSYYRVGESATLSWGTNGSVSNVQLQYYNGTYSAASAVNISASSSNSGTYSWTIPDYIKSAVKIRVSDADSGHPVASNDSAAFTIKGSLNSYPMNTTYAHGGQYVRWNVTGNIGNVQLQYATSTDDVTYSSWTDLVTTDSDWAAGGSTAKQMGEYYWSPVSDVVLSRLGAGALQTQGAAPQVYMKIKVKQADDAANVYNISGPFVVKYHNITWRIIDANGNALTGLNLSEASTTNPVKASWDITDNSLSGNNYVRYYPDNGDSGEDTYSDTFTRSEAGTVYSRSADGWRADSDKVNTYVMDTAATAAVSYNVNIQANYNAENDTIDIVTWLTKKGLLVEKADASTDLTAISVNVYDSNGVQVNTADLGSGKSADSQGIFSGISYDPAGGLDPSQTYTIKAVVTHVSNNYTGATAFTVPSVFTYAVKIGTGYNRANDSMLANVWLERSGFTITDPGDMTLNVYAINGSTLFSQAYDGYDNPSDAAYDTSLKNGVYSGVEWDPAGGLDSNTTYTVKAQVYYRGKNYNAMATFNKVDFSEVTTAVDALGTRFDNVNTSVSNMTTQVTNMSSQVGSMSTQVSTMSTQVGGMQSTLNQTDTNTSKILAAVGSETNSIPEQISALNSTISNMNTTSTQAKILNRETSVKLGTTVTISYQAVAGLSPVIDVYDQNNNQKISGAAMTASVTVGIYEYKLKFLSEWGAGDFNIVCSEATKGTADAVVISVYLHDIDELSSNMAAVQGQTSNLADLQTSVASINSLSTQFNLLDATLAKISGDMVKKVSADVNSNMDTVFNQLTSISKQMQKLNAPEGVNLQKVYEVSKDKKDDLVYLKNKTEELKAVVDMSKKMLEDDSNKPVTQTWMEFN